MSVPLLESYVENSEALVDSVIEWWEKHQHDIVDSENDPRLLYPYPPEFVELAMAIKEKYA